MDYLYHGSKKQNLSEIAPTKNAHKDDYVYTVSNQAFAVIFINRPNGSLLASWGRLDNGIPFFCERQKGVFDSNYDKQSGSLYFFNKRNFFKKKGLWKEEWISDKKVPVIKEIKISDLKKYLENLERNGEFKIIFYEDRLKYFPDFDEELVTVIIQLIQKYGNERILPSVKRLHPKLLVRVINKINKK